MKAFINLSIKNKLIFIIVLVTTIIIAIGFSFIILYDIYTYKDELIENTRINAELIGNYCIAPLTFEDKKVAQDVIDKLRSIPYISVACVYDNQKDLFVIFHKNQDESLPRIIPDNAFDSYNKNYYEVFYPIVYKNLKCGTIYLRASTEILNIKINKHLTIVLIVMLTLILITYFIAQKLQSAISKPIIVLMKAIDKITSTADYSLKVQKIGNDEIGLLYDSFNEMVLMLANREKERNIAENRLRESQKEIQAINQELEQRVNQRTAQLLASNKELEAFSYSVAHDLRAPLRAIDGFCQILIEEQFGNLNDQGKDYLQRVRNAAQNMSQLIDDLLKLSHISRDEMNISQVDLSKIAIEVSENIQALQSGRRIEFIIQKDIYVEGDKQLLKIVMENLLENACKYTSKQTSALIEFGMFQQESDTVYFVRDNGAGFDMNYIHKLFHIFQRLHDSSEFKGTGIGLASVQRIIYKHGGKVWAEGEVGKGATFYFTLT